eukprot:CAMPEP_0176187318 /NCGR_PEP_ID=MMETSP0121_2-20121125/2331_1 /TAXON_ID=160619 /ORGANISM="Kryptoperidinium foliaceum, Strain CCMP 1326" /LENGTH=61 /DNA_ID=CAMNT_0017525845 /DNA_START=113 /DNA_END=295 /DNA_ORIENTATION=-
MRSLSDRTQPALQTLAGWAGRAPTIEKVNSIQAAHTSPQDGESSRRRARRAPSTSCRPGRP